MACKRIIACMDVKNGRTVKGVSFANLVDLGEPGELAALYQEQGADEIVLLDISASGENRSTSLRWVERTADRLSIPLTAGGGVSTLDHASALLNSGADKVTVNTAAVRNPELITDIARRYGSQCCVAAVDCRKRSNSWTVLVNGGTEDTSMQVTDWVEIACNAGCGEILLTSWDRDGTTQGFDNELTLAVSELAPVPVIASGGAGCPEDFTAVFTRGKADAALAAGILHRKTYTIEEIKNELLGNGIEVRPC